MDTFETKIFVAVLITAIVLGSVIGYFAFTIFRNHRRHFKQLTKQLMAEMELLENERTRIARDLHDELGPLLTVTKIHMQAAKVVDEEDRGHINKATENIETLTDRFSGIALNLTPKNLIGKGLTIALGDLLEQFKQVSDMRFDYKHNINEEANDITTLHIYRIVQELLHNAIKHSQAKIISVILQQKKNKLYLFFKDDGIGVPVKNDRNGKALGIASLKSRTQMLGGKFSCNSVPGKGTEFFFEIPFDGTDKN
jgi:signal transduction histidine kinase